MLHILGQNEVPPVQQRACLGAMNQRDGRTGGGAQLQGGILPGGSHQLGHIGADLGCTVDGGDHLLQQDDVLGAANRLQGFHGLHLAAVTLQHVHLLLHAGIADGNTQEKAVHLRLGQGIGAHKLTGVLGGQHNKGLRQGMGNAVHGDLVFLHNLQQAGLGFGAGTVDFIRQHHLAHHRAGLVLHFSCFEIDQCEARDVRWHQVRGKLDTLEGAIQGLGQCAGQGGFAHAGHVLNQYMALAQQGN